MSKGAKTKAELAKELELLRKTADSLRDQVAKLRKEVKETELFWKCSKSHLSNTHHSVLATTGISRIYIDDDGTVLQNLNYPFRLGLRHKRIHIADLFGTAKASEHFGEILELRRYLENAPPPEKPPPWEPVYCSHTNLGPPLDTWLANAPDEWDIRSHRATTLSQGKALEHYLSSPKELIGSGDDFRIEYKGRAERDPNDLSVVVGGRLNLKKDAWRLVRPDANGYGFVFGGMENATTELQRRMWTISLDAKVRIVPGEEYSCVAQRTGARLQFIVDDRVACSVLDPLPIMGRGNGFVSLYTCGPEHTFTDVTVSTRPSSLPPEIRIRVEALRRVVLEVADEPGRYFEVYYAGPKAFVFKDVSDVIARRKQAEDHQRELQEKLSLAQKMESLGLLAGGVAHDLNNMLGPIVGMPDLIIEDLQVMQKDGLEDMEQTIEDLSMVAASARRVSKVVRDLLILSRRGDYEKTAVDINQIVRTFLESMDFVATKESMPNVQVQLGLQDGILNTSGSELHLVRVLSNLLTNSLEAMAETGSDPSGASGTLMIRTLKMHFDEPMAEHETIPPGDYVVLEVADTGKGIDKEYLPRIFEPFFTRKKQTSRSGGGLGLAIVHGVVKDHDGFIEVESRKGESTTVRIYFPTSFEKAKRPSAETPVQKGKERVLVVDDELPQRVMAKRILEKLGYLVSTAVNGQDGVKYFKKELDKGMPFDVVLLDMIMEEGFDGLVTYEKILEMRPGQKAVLSSGYSATRRAKAAIELGAAWLPKPYDRTALASIVRQELDRSAEPES